MHNWRSFLFLRHGQTNWNLEGRYQGQSDIPLNETGLAQARDAAGRLKALPIDRIVSSPLVRALKTAAIVAEATALPVHVAPELSERSFGAFDGLVIADVKRKHGIPLDQSSASILPADAEQWTETVARVKAAVEAWMDKHHDENILFVAHDGIFGSLCETLLDRKLVSKHGSPYAFERTGETWLVSEVS